MAVDGGRKSRSLKEQLFDDASRFSFLQAVRLLEQIRPRRDSNPPAEGVSPRHELVLFRHGAGLDFPESDVVNIVPPSATDVAPRMTVNVLGLSGALGPLPHHVSEKILERSFRGDDASRDFLDIFNHRLISLLYRARKKYRPPLDARGPDGGRVSTVLYALLGLGTRHLRYRMGIDDRSLLDYTGFLSTGTRSVVGLERLVEDCFSVPAKIVPFQGRWHKLQAEDTTRLGVTGQNQLLGRGAMLGSRVWDQSASFEVRIGPMSSTTLRTFLPGGRAFAPLVSLVRFYVREELGFTIRAVVRKSRIPRARLSTKRRLHLGWNTWLKTRALERDDSQVTVLGRT